jgi:hypothetical protein
MALVAGELELEGSSRADAMLGVTNPPLAEIDPGMKMMGMDSGPAEQAFVFDRRGTCSFFTRKTTWTMFF